MTLICMVTVAMLSCMQSVTTIEPAPEVKAVEAPTIAPVNEPVSEPYIKEDIVLKPIKRYPAYITEGATIYGIPATAQGITHRERIEIETDDESLITGTITFYVIDGIIYLSHEYTETVNDEPVNYLDLYKQVDDTIELVDAIPKMPAVGRVTLDTPQWFIESVMLSGVEYSYVYSRNDDVIDILGGTAKGALLRRYGMVSGYAVLDNGLLLMTDEGARFIPTNRAAVNEMGDTGRLWK